MPSTRTTWRHAPSLYYTRLTILDYNITYYDIYYNIYYHMILYYRASDDVHAGLGPEEFGLLFATSFPNLGFAD